ncbi:MAG: nucleotidyl transferase AbiEii/AbiGii toxin family protein [Myxococcota bacterium]
MTKPTRAAGYQPELAIEARSMCLYVATILGDLSEEIVVVGGLVPYLIIDQEEATVPHVGTRDLDLGLSLALLDEERYREVADRLRDRGFEPGTKAEGRMTRQTWLLQGSGVTIDFLIPTSEQGPPPGRLQNLEGDFAAIVTPALPVAFLDHISVTIDGRTPAGELAQRSVNVCGPAAFVVMKAHAFHLRGENKDAYDLVYVLTNFGDGTTADVAERFAGIAEMEESTEALRILGQDFASEEHVGPIRAADFLTLPRDPRNQADAYGYVQAFLRRVRID